MRSYCFVMFPLSFLSRKCGVVPDCATVIERCDAPSVRQVGACPSGARSRPTRSAVLVAEGLIRRIILTTRHVGSARAVARGSLKPTPVNPRATPSVMTATEVASLPTRISCPNAATT